MDFKIFLHSLVDILNEMSPYILLGFLIAGFLQEFIKPETMSRHLAGRGWKPVVKAALLGIPLPLCSCGVLPTAIGLHRQGASKGATTSFLIATPQTGVDSIAATYSLLGLPLAIIRPVAALAGGFLGGLGVNKFADRGAKNSDACHASNEILCHADSPYIKQPLWKRILSALRYGMIDMVGNVGKWLVAGLLIAALITVYVPDEFLLSLSDRPLLAMLAMVIVAVPMYVCATGSIPIAMSLMLKGLNPGAAFVLLMAGPAANFASVILLGKNLGKRTTAVYIASVVLTALAFGLLIDYILPISWFPMRENLTGGAPCHHEIGLFPMVCTIILIMALSYSFYATRNHNHNHSINKNMTQIFNIKGMACNHCRMSVEKAIASVAGVTAVNVDLSAATAQVEGDFSEDAIIKAVTDAGFDVSK